MFKKYNEKRVIGVNMGKKNKDTVISLPLIIVKTQWWLSALVSQISRVEENMNSTEYESQAQRIADDHFLKISLKKLYEWLIEMDKYVENFEGVLNELRELYNIKLLRDVSEHEVDYYKQNGNKQKEFVNEIYNQSIIKPLIINGVYYIGGKININELKSILNELEDILNNSNYNIKYEAIYMLDKLMKMPIV